MYFDVGANFGNRIEPIINKDLKIVAVEPQKECIDFLKEKYGSRITIVPKGLGEKVETRTMYISDANTLTSFSKEFINKTQESGRFSQYNWREEQEIEITTLDKLIEIYGVPKFIKIDVEGFEFEVLKGLSHSVDYISFEYAVPEMKDSILNCVNRIDEISKNKEVFFNYSIGETMEWSLNNWLSATEMRAEISGDRFLNSEFGDIYSKII